MSEIQESAISVVKEKKRHFFSLDFTKFILSVLIVFHHFQQITNTKFENFNFFFGRIAFGYIVEFFFIISGFVCAYGIEGRQIESFRKWFPKKCVRIYPMSILSVLATFSVSLLYKFLTGDFLSESAKPGLWRLLNSITLTFVGGGVDLQIGINNPIWYLNILLICYVVLYLCLWVARKLKIPAIYGFVFISAIGVGIVSYDINLPFLNNYTGRGYAAFFWGMILFQITKKGITKLQFALALSGFLATSAALILHFGIDKQWGTYTFIFFPSILILALKSEKFFKSKIFSLLGSVSFEMYLWHVPAIYSLVLARKVLGINQVFSRAEMLIFTLVIFTFASLLYKFIEIPLTKKLKARLNIT